MSTATKPVPVSDLSGPALDWVVAGLEGTPREIVPTAEHPRKFFTFAAGYSSNWSLSGPIIEREDISVIRCDDESIPDSKGFYCGKYEPRWAAVIGDRHSTESDYGSQGDYWGEYYKIMPPAITGHAPLIAAMRCYVASRLGDTVQIPGELL